MLSGYWLFPPEIPSWPPVSSCCPAEVKATVLMVSLGSAVWTSLTEGLGASRLTKSTDLLGSVMKNCWHLVISLLRPCNGEYDWCPASSLLITHLNILPLTLVVKNMSHVFTEDSLPARTSVNSSIGDSNWPGRVTDGHLQVLIAGFHIVSSNAMSHDFSQMA